MARNPLDTAKDTKFSILAASDLTTSSIAYQVELTSNTALIIVIIKTFRVVICFLLAKNLPNVSKILKISKTNISVHLNYCYLLGKKLNFFSKNAAGNAINVIIHIKI